jgi:hypothetical protein
VREQIEEGFEDIIERRLRQIPFGLRVNAFLDSARFVEKNIPLHLHFPGDELRRKAVQMAPRDGLMLEFGVAQANWINRMASWTPDRHWYGFDSFQGLPEPWSLKDAGYFSLENLPAVRDNITLVKGWFSETLPQFLVEHPEPVSFVHVDCDLYSSTKTVLDLLAPRLRVGSTLVLDDFLLEPGWQHQEHKAWFDVTANNPDIAWTYLGYQDEWPSVGVQITRVGA